MRKILIIAVVSALVASTAALAAPADPTTKNASVACASLRAKMGVSAFAQAYSSFGACVSVVAKVEQANTSSAESACRTEQADTSFAASHGGKTFVQFYGTGKNGRNAFGNCVSAKAKAASQAEAQGRLNPAQTCRSLRVQLGASTFALTYGANAHDRNAFGKCVSKTARAQVSNEVSAAATCSGKAEAQAGGAAFGSCVSTQARASSQAQVQATVTAAKACKAELDLGIAGFKVKYGTFGMCVSQHTK